MQEILHSTIIALPVAFAVFMILDLIANLNQLWISCKPSTPVSIPASIQASLPKVAEPVAEPEELELMPDPWEFEPCLQPIVSTPRLTVVPSNLLLLPPAKPVVEVVEVVPTAKRKAGRPKKEVTPAPIAVAAKRRGRPRKTA